MKINPPVSVSKIASYIGAEVIGDKDAIVTGINELHKVEPGDLMFVDLEKYFHKALTSDATFIILNKKIEAPEGKTLLYCENPFKAFKYLTRMFRPTIHIKEPIHPTTDIGEDTIIESNVIISEHVKIGTNCRIHANVTIYDHVTIGNNVIIHSGTVIGGHAFYYKKENGAYERWHSVGDVVIEDDVEIGSNCSIDKGVTGSTVIGKGTKIDNLCQVAHGAVIGKHCIVAAQTGISGKTIIGDNCVIYGQVGISPRIHIGDNTIISAQSGVSKSLEGGKWYFGSPAIEGRIKHRELAALRQLPELMKKIHKFLKD